MAHSELDKLARERFGEEACGKICVDTQRVAWPWLQRNGRNVGHVHTTARRSRGRRPKILPYWLPSACPRRIVAEMSSHDPTLERRVASIPSSDPRTRSESMASASRALRSAEHVCILTGREASAESGIPACRDALVGWWSRYAATVRAAQPNAAHRALVALAERVSRCTVITQDVDDLHQRAGSRDVIALRGSVLHARCSAGCAGRIALADDPQVAALRCRICEAALRPDMVGFDEPLPMAGFEAARSAAVACDVFVSAGTSHIAEPAASLPWLAASHGATVIVINPSMTGQRRGPSILLIDGPAVVLLPQLVQAAFAGKRPRPRGIILE